MFNPSSNGTNKGRAHKKAVAEVTKWVTEALTSNDVFHGEQFQVMVTEILCNEPNCAPIETLIIVMLMELSGDVSLNGKNSQKWANKILKPVAEVSKSDVDDLIQEVFLSENDDEPSTTESEQQLELFEAELIALIHKYSHSDSRKLINILQSQINTISQRTLPVETVLASIPVEPVRTVTMVTMKPTVTKSTTVSSQISQSSDTTLSVETGVTKVNMISAAVLNTAVITFSTSSTTVNATEVVTPPTGTGSEISPVIPAAVPNAAKPVVSFTPQDLTGATATIAPRHKKGGTRPRGCPCCDPDNLDNIIDSMLFSHYPQT